jgi:hypothetical protein
MKKFILSLTALAGCSLASFAQGYISFDGSNNSNPSLFATSSGLVFINFGVDTTQDINAELLYGTSPYFYPQTPVVTLLLSSSDQGPTSAIGQTLSAAGDITDYANGTLYDASGDLYQIPNIPAGSTAYFQVEAWSGNYNTFDEAVDANVFTGVTATFSEVLSSGTSPLPSYINNMPALSMTVFFPEPNSLTMAAVGIGSMLIISGCTDDRIRRFLFGHRGSR